tara:strand:+ start:214 stop:1173 length:960 start_codon:yes stop_codon:yes gene_type:complete
MSDLYGYSSALSQGSAFNSRVKDFNDGVLAHNQILQDQYDAKVKNRPGKVAGDGTKKDEDEAFYGFKDGTGTMGVTAGLYGAGKGISKAGLSGYVTGETGARINTIGRTVKSIVKGTPAPPPAKMIPKEGEVVSLTADPVQTPQDIGLSAGKDAGAAAEDTESSGILTGGIKAGLKLAVGDKIGEAGLSAISEIGGKAIGDFGGAVDIGKSVENLADGKNVFSGETTADKYQEAGAAFDLVGTVFPPAEVVGGVLGLIGGIDSAYQDIKGDIDKKHKDAAAPVPPKKTAIKVSPAFQSMGLVASSMPSAKSQIVGGNSF